jgi:hypothetical protein
VLCHLGSTACLRDVGVAKEVFGTFTQPSCDSDAGRHVHGSVASSKAMANHIVWRETDNLFFQLVSFRYERASLLVSSKRPSVATST